ncbi:MAG TPA: rhodanese-like domain-containing protein, partial [Chromatiales bacterium]|nr:rhodanese-like domain-containing protein [Chromatiales bacterium]
MKKLSDLVAEALTEVEEQFPWDLSEYLEQGKELLLLDIREPAEYAAMHIAGSINVPRGILESSCEFGFDDTIPELAMARDKEIAVICRSGNRSALAALTMKWMGYQ